MLQLNKILSCKNSSDKHSSSMPSRNLRSVEIKVGLMFDEKPVIKFADIKTKVNKNFSKYFQYSKFLRL